MTITPLIITSLYLNINHHAIALVINKIPLSYSFKSASNISVRDRHKLPAHNFTCTILQPQ